MTTLTTPDLDLLHDLEWVPACHAPRCASHWQQPATHIGIYLVCPHPPCLMCTPCAEKLARDIAKAIVYESQCHACGKVLYGQLADWIRIEPLP